MDPSQEELQGYAKQYGQVVAKAWADDGYKARFLAEPAAVLQEEGVVVPPGVELRAVENTDSVLYLTLPPKPSDELSDEQLNQVAGGSTGGTAGTLVTISSICSCFSTLGSIGSAGSAG